MINGRKLSSLASLYEMVGDPPCNVAIYCIWENGAIVYVGSTRHPTERFKSHTVSDRFLGRTIEMEVLMWVNAEERDETEKLAIKLGLHEGYPLENVVHNRRDHGYEHL